MFTFEIPDLTELEWEVSQLGEFLHSNCRDKSGVTGSGFDRGRIKSMSIAYSELIERNIVGRLLSSSQEIQNSWGLNIDDSCSGFAVGPTLLISETHALLEAYERWRMSQWIDSGYALKEVSWAVPESMLPETNSIFSSVRFFNESCSIAWNGTPFEIHLVVCFGISLGGVFVGYGTKLSKERAIEHALVEALRNFAVFKNRSSEEGFPFDRIRHFAESGIPEALFTNQKSAEGMPAKKYLLSRSEQVGDIFLSRIIFDGWRPWQEGGCERFLY